MNTKHQSPISFLLFFIISFALYSTSSYANDCLLNFPGDDKISSDSLELKKGTAAHQLKYALMHNYSGDVSSVLENSTTKSIGKPASFILNDGTTWFYKSEFDPLKLAGMAGVVLTVEIFGYYRLKELWYDWPTSKFHTHDFTLDFQTYKWMDKFGHFMHAYFASDLFSKGYRWAGMNGDNSILYGSLSGWLWMLQIEIADGFFKQWGFSWGDVIANTLGSGFSALQQTYPEALGGLQPKFSYHESKALRDKRYSNGSKSWIDDYEGITWWMGVNPYHYMPKEIQNNYPEWLKPFGFAAGYSANGIADSPQGGEREILIGLDYDLRKLSIGNESSLIRFLKNELNIIRLPLPAVKITQGGVWYGLYF